MRIRFAQYPLHNHLVKLVKKSDEWVVDCLIKIFMPRVRVRNKLQQSKSTNFLGQFSDAKTATVGQ